MLVASSGQCQPLKYLKKHRETAPVMIARVHDVDTNGPSPNTELFRWIDPRSFRGHRMCELKVHHPRACRAYAFQTDRGFVIARIEDKTSDGRHFNHSIRLARLAFNDFLREGEQYG